MYAVMGAMLAIMVLSVAAFAAASGDQSGARYDQDSKRAYSAAEAGVNWYASKLASNSEFWTKCVPTLPAGEQNPVNQPWNGTSPDPRNRMDIPGSDAEFTLELVPVSPATQCDTANSTGTMINPTNNTFQIRATGFANSACTATPDPKRRCAKRTIVATFRRKGFLDYLYFSDIETATPTTFLINAGGYPSTEDMQTWATRDCGKWYRDGRGSAVYNGKVFDPAVTGGRTFVDDCHDVRFHPSDVINGPLHTNDDIATCGAPTFGRTSADAIEVSGAAPGYRADPGCSGGPPNFVGTFKPSSPVLPLPPSNSQLKSVVDPAYLFTGKTNIVLSGTNVIVNGVTKPMPPNGVIYVQNGTCGSFYDPTKTAAAETPAGCGDAWVHGSYSANLTIGAEKDVVVDGNTTRSGDFLLGLIANNFVRVANPVTSRTKTWGMGTEANQYLWNCTNTWATPTRTIEAAILALNYSFIIDNYYCGNDLGTLTVRGTIAQKYRGIVRVPYPTGQPGYLKDYNYDDRLKYRQPPNFLDPVQAGWNVISQVEQTPPR